MPLKDVKYKRDQTILKVYGYGDNKKIKVIRMNWLRTAGIEDDEEYRAPKGSVNDFKLDENIQRAKNAIFEYAFAILGTGSLLALLTLKSMTVQTLKSFIKTWLFGFVTMVKLIMSKSNFCLFQSFTQTAYLGIFTAFCVVCLKSI